MSEQYNIRTYQSRDRESLRELCCNVADRGNPIEPLFFDRFIAAELLTRYYTDYEPESSFVAEAPDGKIVGYLNASLDNRRYGLVMFWILGPLAVSKAFKRGVFFRQQFWFMMKVLIRNWPRLFDRRTSSFHSHLGHVHIGIDAQYRHQHVGERLMDALFSYARTQGTFELFASVHGLNVPACRFFERMGFVIRERHPMIAPRSNTVEPYESLLYVKRI